MSEKHSPLPWNAVVSVLDPCFMKIRDSRGDSVAYEIGSEDDAAYIVLAANAFPALVAVIEDMLSGMEYLRQTKQVPYGFGIDRLEETGKAALKLAKGEPHD